MVSDVPGVNVSRIPVSNSLSAFCLLILSSVRASSAESVIPNLFSSAIFTPPYSE